MTSEPPAGSQATGLPARAPRRSRSPQLILLISLLAHLVLTPAIFDIYFKTPVVEVAERYSVESDCTAFAKRVVLFVGAHSPHQSLPPTCAS